MSEQHTPQHKQDEHLQVQQATAAVTLGPITLVEAQGKQVDIETAVVMAEVSDKIRTKIAKARTPGEWEYLSNEDDRNRYVENHEHTANEVERWAGILHKARKNGLDDLTENLSAVSSLGFDGLLQGGSSANRDHMTAEKAYYTTLEIDDIRDHFKHEAEKVATLPLVTQVEEYLLRLEKGTRSTWDQIGNRSRFYHTIYLDRNSELQAQKDKLKNDPSTTLGELLEFSKNAYLEHFVKPIEDDESTKEFLLQSLEQGVVPTPEDLVNAVPDNQGLIARGIRETIGQ